MLDRGPQIENTRHAKATVAVAKRIIAVEEADSASGVYHEVPTTLELPSDTNRLIFAKVEPGLDDCGRMRPHLTFGRWQLRNDVWFEDFQKTPI